MKYKETKKKKEEKIDKINGNGVTMSQNHKSPVTPEGFCTYSKGAIRLQCVLFSDNGHIPLEVQTNCLQYSFIMAIKINERLKGL